MKNSLLLSFLLLALPGLSLAQTLERSVIGTTGSSSTAGNIHISSTVGEAVIQTGQSGSFILTQGFQQPDANPGTPIEDFLEYVINYELYPNPTSDQVTLTLTMPKPLKLEVGIYDMRARKTQVPSQTQMVQQDTRFIFSLASLAEGTYLLLIKDEHGKLGKSLRITKR